MRVVLDTDVVISGLLWRGTPAMLLELLAHRRALYTTEPLLRELHRTALKKKLMARLLAADRTPDNLVSDYAASCHMVTPVSLSTELRDQDDVRVLEAGVGAAADLIVSGDQHLLELKRFRSLRIVTSAEAMAALTV